MITPCFRAGSVLALSSDAAWLYAQLPSLPRPHAATGATVSTRGSTATSPSVRVLNVHGPIFQRPNLWTSLGFATSTMQLERDLRRAVADRDVRTVLLDVDSPGGEVFGVQELAATLRRLRIQKQIVAVINSAAGSAAYQLAASATNVSITPSGEVGSIGVVSMHEDWSVALDARGVKVSLIHAATYKTEGNPYEPLLDEARAYVQRRVETHYRQMLRDISEGRMVGTSKIESDYGAGRMLGAEAALKAGMVDKVETLDRALARLSGVSAARSQAPIAQTRSDAALAEVRAARTHLEADRRAERPRSHRICGFFPYQVHCRASHVTPGYLTFEPGALKKAIAGNRIQLWRAHDEDRVFATQLDGTLRLTESKRGVSFEASVEDSPAARALVSDIQSGKLCGVSLGWHPSQSVQHYGCRVGGRDYLVRIQEAAVYEISITDRPAFQSSYAAVVQ